MLGALADFLNQRWIGLQLDESTDERGEFAKMGIFIKEYRGERIYCRSIPRLDSWMHDYVYVGVNTPGIWFTLQALCDYIDFRRP